MQTKSLRILRTPEVRTIRGRSNSSHYNDIKAELFTQPVHIGPNAVGWPEHEVMALQAARIAGKSDDEIRALVRELHAARTAESVAA